LLLHHFEEKKSNFRLTAIEMIHIRTENEKFVLDLSFKINLNANTRD